MTIKFACDGCDTAVDKPHTRGIVKPAHYCDNCVLDIDAYLKARDALHTECAKHFKEKAQTLKDDYRQFHPDGKLPDE